MNTFVILVFLDNFFSSMNFIPVVMAILLSLSLLPLENKILIFTLK